MDGDKLQDDNITSHHIYFIEAHEIAHYILGKNELKADYGGIYLCKQKGLIEAADIGIEEFNKRYWVGYNIIDKLFGQYLQKRIDKFLGDN